MTANILSFLSISITMSVIILLVYAVHLLFAQWVTARLRYAVWLVVLAGFIIPLRPSLGEGIVAIPLFTNAPTQYQWVVTTAPDSLDESARQAQTVITQAIPYRFESALFTVIAFLWAVVAIAIFAYHIHRYTSFIRVVQRWGTKVEDSETLELYRSILREKGLENKKIELVRCNFVSTSMLTGFFNPIIILPAKEFSADELEMIFRHELIHYKRGDMITKLISTFAISLHWFNPIAYLMCSAMQTECEASCDESVLRDIGNDSKQFYAELIVEMVGRKKPATMLSTCFYGGKKSLKRRLDSIMDGTLKMRKPAYVGLLCIVFMSVMSGSVFAFSIHERLPVIINIDITDRATRPMNPPITFYRAVEIATEYIGEDFWLEEVSMDFERGRWIWEVEVEFDDNSEAEVHIDIITGEVLWVDWD
jgi:beta-lactamase regulating signal transducer with metallopeptidase domain